MGMLYITDPNAAAAGAVPTDQILWVFETGDDGTAEPGRLDLPYATAAAALADAIANAMAGAIIQFGPGDFPMTVTTGLVVNNAAVPLTMRGMGRSTNLTIPGAATDPAIVLSANANLTIEDIVVKGNITMDASTLTLGAGTIIDTSSAAVAGVTGTSNSTLKVDGAHFAQQAGSSCLASSSGTLTVTMAGCATAKTAVGGSVNLTAATLFSLA